MYLLDINGKRHDLQFRDLRALSYENSTQTTHVTLRDGNWFDVFMTPKRLLLLLEA